MDILYYTFGKIILNHISLSDLNLNHPCMSDSNLNQQNNNEFMI